MPLNKQQFIFFKLIFTNGHYIQRKHEPKTSEKSKTAYLPDSSHNNKIEESTKY